MRIREPGRVCEGLWFLGHKESGVYLLEGKNHSMFISGGMGQFGMRTSPASPRM